MQRGLCRRWVQHSLPLVLHEGPLRNCLQKGWPTFLHLHKLHMHVW